MKIGLLVFMFLFVGCGTTDITSKGSVVHTKERVWDQNLKFVSNKTVYQINENIKITLANVKGADNNWVGIYKKGTPSRWDDVYDQKWFYFENGSLDLRAPAQSGDYEIRLFYNDSLNVEKTISIKVTKNANNILSIDKNKYARNETISVNLSHVLGADNNWVGVYKKDDQSGWDNVYDQKWFYFENGTLDLNAPAQSGDYQVRLFYNDSLDVEEVVDFSVVAGGIVKADKKIFVIGDSTVHNETVDNNGVQVNYGWADLLPNYMKHSENLINQAQEGRSSRTYQDRSQYENEDWFHNWYQTKELIKNSDISHGAYLFIQFGHNDETDVFDDGIREHTLPGRGESFYNHMRRYITEARDLGVVPVLVTPVERLMKQAGEQTNRSHNRVTGDYIQTIKDLAVDEGVLLLDLEHRSWQEFNNYYDSNALRDHFGYRDVEHFNHDGALEVAGWLKDVVCDSDDKILCRQFKLH